MNQNTSLPKRFTILLATGLGTGYAPVAPGTFGSLLGPPLAWLCGFGPDNWMITVVVGTLLFLIGVPICVTGGSHFGVTDAKQIVFDEIAAFALVFLFVPVTLWTGLIGFALFRLFDIWKPWPIRRFERLPGGWGVMADDTVAGLFAGGFLKLIVLAFAEFR